MKNDILTLKKECFTNDFFQTYSIKLDNFQQTDSATINESLSKLKQGRTRFPLSGEHYSHTQGAIKQAGNDGEALTAAIQFPVLAVPVP